MKLTDLKVAQLKAELEKRELDKSGVKAVLQERLQKVLTDEGHDPETFDFDSEANDVSVNESQDEESKATDDGEEEAEEEVGANEEGEQNEGGEQEETNDKEEEQIVMVNEEEMGEFDSEKPKDKKKSGTKGKGASPSKSPPRPDSVPVVVPFTSKDTIELASKPKPSSDDASLVVHIDGQSVRNESIGQNGNAEESKTEEGSEETAEKKTEDSASKSSQSTEAATEAKDKDKKQQSSPNLWVSGLASTTRATDLKQIFSKHGKVTGAKVVTNAKTPGSRCYGFVTMASSEEASTCIQHLHRTELHGRMISVERAKTEPAVPQKKREEKKVSDTDKDKDVKTEGDKEHKKPLDNRHQNHRGSAASRDRRGPKDVLSFDKIKEERERQKIRDQERQAREDSRRQREERERQRERERRHRDEQMRMDRERRELRMERQRLEKEKMELLKIQKEQTRIERRRIEREKEQLLREQRRLSDSKRKRSPDYGYDDRKKSRYTSSRDSHRSREKEDLKLKLERERLRRRSPVDSRRVVERPRYKEEVPSRWPPASSSSHHSSGPSKPPSLHHSTGGAEAKWPGTPGWGRVGGAAPLLGAGGGWGAPMGAPPPSHIMMPHHSMGNPPYGSAQPPSYPVMRRY